MTKHQFEQIEKALSIRLPGWYTKALEKYPLPGHDVTVFWDPKDIVDANSELRGEGWYGKNWPAGFLVIGEDGCGGSYFINLHSDDSRVYLADRYAGLEPGLGTLKRMASSATLEAHIAAQLALQEESSDY